MMEDDRLASVLGTLHGGGIRVEALLSSVNADQAGLYELRTPGDGQEEGALANQVRLASQKFLDMAYAGLEGPSGARIVIALRVPDYGSELPAMLQTLEAANGANPHFLGWAEHSYNEQLERVR